MHLTTGTVGLLGTGVFSRNSALRDWMDFGLRSRWFSVIGKVGAGSQHHLGVSTLQAL